MAKLDRKGKRAQWTKARNGERAYNSALRSVAKQVGAIVKGMAPKGVLSDVKPLLKALTDYAKIIEPWAGSVAGMMLADVARRDKQMWRRHSQEMGTEMRQLLTSDAPVSQALAGLQSEQVTLIKSLPLEAAERVHSLSLQSLIESRRASEVAAEILATESVTEGRARLIARTEVARAASNLTQARSQYAGSDGYIWRTSGDMNVRESHEKMEGKYVRWSEPPTLDNLTGHAGTLPNCRCFAEPIFPND